MLNSIIALSVLVVLIMFSTMIKNGLKKLGGAVEKIADSAEHIVDAGADQAKRARVVSNDSLQDTKLESVKLASKRETIKADFMKGLNVTQKKAVDSHSDWLNSL